MGDDSLLYFDTGVLLNMLATERAAEIFQAIPYTCASIEDLQDILCLKNRLVAPHTTCRDPEERSSLLHTLAYYIHKHQFDRSAHASIFVQLAQCVPERKAALLALVVTNNGFLASDDLCTRNILSTFFPQVQIISTLSILRIWRRTCHISDMIMQQVALEIQEYAQFTPLDSDPLLPWWKHILGERSL